MRKAKHRRRIAVAALVLALVISAGGFYLFRPPLPAELALPKSDLRLAAWLGVTWSKDARSPAEIRSLATELKARQVDDLFIYVSYLNAEGRFNPTYGHTAKFVSWMKAQAPDLRLLAWIGIPASLRLASGEMADNRLDETGIRSTISDFSRFAVTDLGFDGVHLNVEPVTDGDAMFIETLMNVRENLPDAALLSTTAHPLQLDSARTALPYPQVAHHWSVEYFRTVAERSDQIVLMAYDSGLPFPRDYLNWLAYQVEASASALKVAAGELIIGLPTSEEWTPSHQTQAESLRIALAGLRAGFDDRIDGIAIYPYWETDAEEWRLIDSGLGR